MHCVSIYGRKILRLNLWRRKILRLYIFLHSAEEGTGKTDGGLGTPISAIRPRIHVEYGQRQDSCATEMMGPDVFISHGRCFV